MSLAGPEPVLKHQRYTSKRVQNNSHGRVFVLTWVLTNRFWKRLVFFAGRYTYSTCEKKNTHAIKNLSVAYSAHIAQRLLGEKAKPDLIVVVWTVLTTVETYL